jgi:hypothetical protein
MADTEQARVLANVIAASFLTDFMTFPSALMFRLAFGD